jgi:hypothetical protein
MNENSASDAMYAINISAVLFQEGEWWSAQCLEYDIAAQAKTIPELHREFERVLCTHIAASVDMGRKPFEGLEPAPRIFWKMYQNAKLRVEGDSQPFRLPTPVGVPQLVSKLKIAEQRADC